MTDFVSLVLALEQMASQAVQEESSTSWTPWLEVVAAFGTPISLLTLALTVVFYRRDNQTRAITRVEVRDEGIAARPESIGSSRVYFQVVGKSKVPLHLSDRAYLGTWDDYQALILIKRAAEPTVVQQGSIRNYIDDLSYVRMMLHKKGYEDTAFLYFVVQDASGRTHEQPILVEGLKEPDTTTVTALPFPWYKRWSRRLHRWWHFRGEQPG